MATKTFTTDDLYRMTAHGMVFFMNSGTKVGATEDANDLQRCLRERGEKFDKKRLVKLCSATQAEWKANGVLAQIHEGYGLNDAHANAGVPVPVFGTDAESAPSEATMTTDTIVYTMREGDECPAPGCHNTSHTSGFYACDPAGNVYRDAEGFPDGPDINSDWEGHYRCEECGALSVIADD